MAENKWVFLVLFHPTYRSYAVTPFMTGFGPTGNREISEKNIEKPIRDPQEPPPPGRISSQLPSCFHLRHDSCFSHAKRTNQISIFNRNHAKQTESKQRLLLSFFFFYFSCNMQAHVVCSLPLQFKKYSLHSAYIKTSIYLNPNKSNLPTSKKATNQRF